MNSSGADLWAHWKLPKASEGAYVTGLKLNNSLRPNQLVPFIPHEGRLVKFYYCGPTVYSYSHLGHARTYIYLDIIKRLLRDYFKYDLFTVMNITDIEDKIIKGANQEGVDFLEFTKKWEKDFFDSMDDLQVELPDVITRVSEFVPDIVQFIEKIISNGYAYESNGSVYFDVQKFQKDGFNYCKIEPFSAMNQEKLAEGEGYTQQEKSNEKRSAQDFALWKDSKPGEPKWPSPWGQGRPGWHIECSVMAHSLLGEKIDISAGGEDLKFPHHDNSIAQTEAYLKCDQWINYFIHTGHLNIHGLKMSKSQKNFYTIGEILQRFTSRQLRLNFVFHHYDAIQNYSEEGMSEAVNKDKQYNEFFLTLRAILRNTNIFGAQRWQEKEHKLIVTYNQTSQKVHEHLCDNLNFPSALKSVDELIYATNIYLKSADPQKPILQKVYKYVNDFLSTLGLNYEPKQEKNEDLITPLMNTFANFRDGIRVAARDKDFKQIFQLCDKVRDDDLVNLGIKLDDKAIGQASMWKYSDREQLLQEREQKIALKAKQEEEKRLLAEQKLEKERQRLEQMKLTPKEYFLAQSAQYSQFDETGLPTHDKEGKELSKKQAKVVKQQWDAQHKAHQEYLQQIQKPQVQQQQTQQIEEQKKQ